MVMLKMPPMAVMIVLICQSAACSAFSFNGTSAGTIATVKL